MSEMQWKYSVGDRIVDYDENKLLDRDLTIIDRKIEIKQHNRKDRPKGYEVVKIKFYKYQCNVCGALSGWVSENSLFYRKSGCCKPARINWKYKIGDTIVDYTSDNILKRSLTIIDRKVEVKQYPCKRLESGISNHRVKFYKYRCNVCGWSEGWLRENDLCIKTTGCSCCCNRTTVKGVNDVATTHPHLVKYFKNSKEAFLYSAYSNYRPKLVCPNCGYVKTAMAIHTLSKHGFGCQACSDGISYSEKFLNALLKQLNIEYKPQLSRTTYLWCNNYRYDFWFKYNNEEFIVETHGLQHYELQKNWSDHVIEDDKIKKDLANKNGFSDKHYIVLDCRHSDCNWIKNSVLNSVLAQLFDLSKIDWDACNSIALKSLVKDVCEYWENNKHLNITTVDVAKEFNISSKTVRLYLKQGNKLNLCEYVGQEELKKIGKRFRKRVVALDSKMNVLKVFDSCLDVENESMDFLGSFVKRNTVGHVCAENDRRKDHYLKGYYFWYLEDYIKEFGEDSLQGIA